jgi:hypothetical protein
MTQMNIKVTTLALSIFAVIHHAEAALYNVVEVDPPSSVSSSSYQSVFGVAVQPSSDDTNSATNFNSCFKASSIDGTACSDFEIAAETRTQKTMAGQAVDGVSFRDEAPFGLDNAFSYVQTENDFQNYCGNELLYKICDSWAKPFWTEWNKELSGTTTVNSIAFIEGNSSVIDGSNNVVVNSLTSSSEPIGTESSLGDSRATVTALAVTSPTSDSSFDKSRAWKTNGTFTVGSVSSTVTNDYGTYYSSKAAIWGTDGTVVQIAWPSGTENEDDRLAQGSMRDFTVVGSTIYGVGFNTYDSDNNYMNATVFKVASGSYATASNWTSTAVGNARAKIDGDYIYSHTKLTGVNDNLVAIGEAKRAGSRPSNGAAANRLFIIPNVSASTLSATFFSDGSFSGTSISGAGGHANAINNYNEIVGQIDTESIREKDGKPRRKRAFIYPYNGTGTVSARRAIFASQAWLLDDLTNDGSATSNNNQYRILTASDINDAGVIAATAIKCSGGYDSTAENATCGGGSTEETTVAVKLVPIVNATSANIQQRSYEENSSERQGASFGTFGIAALLSLLMFRRRKGFFCKE